MSPGGRAGSPVGRQLRWPRLREVLLTAGTQRDLRVIRSVVQPGGGGAEELYAHLPVEFVHVLRGRLQLRLPEESAVPHKGDAFTMPGATPHTWVKPWATETRGVLWALTPRTVTDAEEAR